MFSLIFTNHKNREIIHMRNCQGEPATLWISKEYVTYYNNYRPPRMLRRAISTASYRVLMTSHQGIGNITIPKFKEIKKGNKPKLSRNILYRGKLCTKLFLDGHLAYHYYKKSA